LITKLLEVIIRDAPSCPQQKVIKSSNRVLREGNTSQEASELQLEETGFLIAQWDKSLDYIIVSR
jgi:hypothetical protein